MKRILIISTILLGCMCLLGSVAFASTEYELEAIIRSEIIYGITGDKQTAPFQSTDAGIESVNTASGNLSYETTDLVLKGKAGHDVVINRKYNSQLQNDEQYNLVVPGSASIYDMKRFIKPIYRYYASDNPSEAIYIAFETEEQLLETENAAAQIQVASDFRDYITSTNWKEDEQFEIWDGDTTIDGRDILDSNFYFSVDLPEGNDVTLTRDIYILHRQSFGILLSIVLVDKKLI